jgi:predicted permease
MDSFGGDARTIGRSILIGDKPYTVIGVMPRNFEVGVDWLGESKEGSWVPSAPTPSNREIQTIIAHLKKGANLTQARTQIQTLSTRFASRFPPKRAQGVQLVVKSLKRRIDPGLEVALVILFGAVGFVLLLTCVNVSALLVARAWTRQNEIAIRRTLGATSLRIIRQLLSESVLLSIPGGALGLLFAMWGIRVLRAIAPPGTPRLDRLVPSSSVLWFTLGISLLAGILFGLAPALQVSSRRLGGALKDGLAGTFAGPGTRRPHWLRSSLVVVEVALAVVLVVGGALMVRSFEKLVHVDTGMRTDHVLTMEVQLGPSQCKEGLEAACALVVKNALNQMNSVIGIQRAAIMTFNMSMYGRVSVEGQETQQGPATLHLSSMVSPNYFAAVGIPFLQGRDFVQSDAKWAAPAATKGVGGKPASAKAETKSTSKASPQVAIVTQSFVRKYVQGNPIGKRFTVSDDLQGGAYPQTCEIIGVVGDIQYRVVHSFFDPPSYYTLAYPQRAISVRARTSADPMAMAGEIERTISSLDKDARFSQVESLDQLVADSSADTRFQTILLASFGALALLLAIIGIYGVISYSVVQRTYEIGVRMSLGARTSDVMNMVIAQGGRLALAGIIFGLAGAWAITRVLRNLLFEIKPTDPPTFIGVAILLLLVALAACYFPARRAARVDPLVALRCD